MIRMIENQEHRGIELYFDNKPESRILTTLKENRFKWHNVKKCWFAKDSETVRKIAEAIAEEKTYVEPAATKKEETHFEFDVKVGDIFVASWGYDQTNLDFFQVIALKGMKSVMIREVKLPIKEERGTSWASREVSFKITNEILEPAEYSSFVKDQQKGMLKRLMGTRDNPYIDLSSFANARLYRGEELYESWYA